MMNVTDVIKSKYWEYDMHGNKELAKENGHTLASSTLLWLAPK
jgi:hypothetical protein